VTSLLGYAVSATSGLLAFFALQVFGVGSIALAFIRRSTSRVLSMSPLRAHALVVAIVVAQSVAAPVTTTAC